jgi:CelD/BcsL family acetyltransferase involved in cellulose biosynthesis
VVHIGKYNAAISPATDIAQIKKEWLRLEEASDKHSFFLSWYWMEPWVEMVIKETQLYLFEVSDNKRVVAICFLTLAKAQRMKGIIRFRQLQLNEYRNNQCDMIIQYNDILNTQIDQETLWRLFISATQQWRNQWHEIYISSISHSRLNTISQTSDNLKIIIDKSHVRWEVPLSKELSCTEDIINTFKSKSRRQLRESLKAFAKVYPDDIQTSPAATVEEAIAYFNEMDSLHTARWVKAGKEGSFANQKWTKFHKSIITRTFDQNGIIMVKVHCGEHTLGYLYGTIYRNKAYMVQTGFAETSHNNLRAGYVSHLCTMLYCAQMGLTLYDFLPDEEGSYKKFFTLPGDAVQWVQLQRPCGVFLLERLMRFVKSLRQRQ